MKAIDKKTNETVYVIDVCDNNGNVLKYVSDSRSYHPNELIVIGE